MHSRAQEGAVTATGTEILNYHQLQSSGSNRCSNSTHKKQKGNSTTVSGDSFIDFKKCFAEK